MNLVDCSRRLSRAILRSFWHQTGLSHGRSAGGQYWSPFSRLRRRKEANARGQPSLRCSSVAQNAPHLPKALLGLAAICAALVLTADGAAQQPDESRPTDEVRQVYLGDLEWQKASTGWVAIPSDGLPAKNTSFIGGAISIGGENYDNGIGTYPVSEITYDLGGAYESFIAEIGLDDQATPNAGAVEFFVFVDDVAAYRSGRISVGQTPMDVRVDVSGAQSLRLVVAYAGDNTGLSYADWADARLTTAADGDLPRDGATRANILDQRRKQQDALTADRIRASRQAAEANTIWQEFASALGLAYREATAADAGTAQAGRVGAGIDPRREMVLIGNDRLALTLSYGSGHVGEISLLDLASGNLVINGAAATIDLPDGEAVRLNRDAAFNSYRIAAVSDPAFGSGKTIDATLDLPTLESQAQLQITLYDGAPYVLYQISLDEPPPSHPIGGPATATRFAFFSSDTGEFALGEDLEYVTDADRLRASTALADGITRREAVGIGKPLLLRDRSNHRGLLLASIDETLAASEFAIARSPESVLSWLAFVSTAIRSYRAGPIVSPRLYIEPTTSDNLPIASANFKAVIDRLYPRAAVPDWVKYQWLSWYVYNMDVTEDDVKRQIDYIVDNLADLGSWSVLIDAGWYVAEGREGSDWHNVDNDKFPSGLASLVAYAHSKGVKVVLYFSSPYLDDAAVQGDWLGLSDVINRHPEWLIPLGDSGEKRSFAYDFNNPELQSYMRDVMNDFFVKYGVDGIKIDGLGNTQGARIGSELFNSFGAVASISSQTMDIYRLVSQSAQFLRNDVYIESGWQTPVFADPMAQTFRYGDEQDSFSAAYPTPGLVQHADYAAFQIAALGQRPNMGAILGDPNGTGVHEQWLQAGLALGTQVVFSFDLPSMTDETLSAYRELLVHYDAFRGDTRFGDDFELRGPGQGEFGPDSFATVAGAYIYLGVFNRDVADRNITLHLRDYGLPEEVDYVALDAASGNYVNTSGAIDVQVPAESFRLLIIRRTPGIMRTNSSFETSEVSQSTIEFVVRGPRAITGFADILVSRPQSVAMDGRELTPSDSNLPDESHYYYQAETGILKLSYPHDAPHRITIVY